ncbi:MAG TPA: hypothetical protein VEY07_00810 [Thermoplasmata archaeon]|nr:hypothetical protein [Thermoplasmata archaeon]
MATPAGPPLAERLATLERHGHELEAEGLPFPTAQLKETADALIATGRLDQALAVVKRGEALYAVASRDWTWIKPTLGRADELRELASTIGLDVTHLENRVGNPRAQFQKSSLSQASLSRAAASASLSVAVLSDAIPKYCVQEAQHLGEFIRRARNRGEDVTGAVGRFSQLLQAIQDQHTVAMARALVDVRHAVARIPRAPSLPPVPSEEEEEILMEARNLARRLQRIKSRAHNAQSAARLMTEVRAALSEDRRFGTPEEEIEALWSEVDRLTRERQLQAANDAPADGAAAARTPPDSPPADASADAGAEPEAPEPEEDPALVESSAWRSRARGRGRP